MISPPTGQIPGTYEAGKPVLKIASFVQTLSVLSSKQRPRKLTIMADDGSPQLFLLKGHEDLRQDERVMQLFGLINDLLATDRKADARDLAIQVEPWHGRTGCRSGSASAAPPPLQSLPARPASSLGPAPSPHTCAHPAPPCSVQRYSVVPLSPNSGLISWVAQCDTLHTLIKAYRDGRKVPLNAEHRLMLSLAPDYDLLPLMHKLEAFEHALSLTKGDDVGRVLWLASRSAEDWLGRRTNYTRSLAVMSMAGYILGLGDRHPSNVMLDRHSSKILHIDFGDCFEVCTPWRAGEAATALTSGAAYRPPHVPRTAPPRRPWPSRRLHPPLRPPAQVAVHRDKFPEKIPFRLTRMLVAAMEVRAVRLGDGECEGSSAGASTPPTPHPSGRQVSGVEGSFRSTCVAAMGVLRRNKDSVMAMLEAFVHDPLINWRLLIQQVLPCTMPRRLPGPFLPRVCLASSVPREPATEARGERVTSTLPAITRPRAPSARNRAHAPTPASPNLACKGSAVRANLFPLHPH